MASRLATNFEGSKIMADRSIVADKIVLDSAKRTISTVASFAAAACQVQMEVDGNGSIISKGCKNVSCSGVCSLQEKDKGNGKIEYTCKCG